MLNRGGLKGGSRDLIKDLYQNLPGGTEKYHYTLQSGYLVSRPRFDPNTCRYRSRVSSLHQPARFIGANISVVPNALMEFHMLLSAAKTRHEKLSPDLP
jgi:hypothetical protein